MEEFNKTNISESNDLCSSVRSLSRIIERKNDEICMLRENLKSANNSSNYWYKKCQELESKLKEMTGDDEQEPEYNGKSEESN